jgi:hypothetical protein
MIEGSTTMTQDETSKAIEEPQEDTEGHAIPNVRSTPERAIEPAAAIPVGKATDDQPTETGTEPEDAFKRR